MPELRDYQKAALARMLGEPERTAWLLADEPGLGKTATALAWLKATDALSALVVCPASLRLNWRREAEQWWDGWEPYLGWDVISYEGLVARSAARGLGAWDAVVFDESHYLKNPSATRTRAAFQVQSARRLFLTGTPVVNRPMDLWPTLHALGLAGSRVDYGRRFCDGRLRRVYAKGGARTVWDFSGASDLEGLAALLSPVMIRRTKAEVLTELPPKTRQVVEISAGNARKATPAGLDGELETWEKWSGEQAFAPMPPALLAELAKIRLEDGLAKMPAVVSYIKDVILEEEEKVVVFAWHREVLEALARELPGTVLLYGGMTDAAKDTAVREFQEGKARVFCGQIQAAGTGLTLTAARTVAFAELDWVPGNITQAEDRCHRLGQRDAVRVIHLVAEGIDARMARALVRKQGVLDALEQERNAALAAPEGRGLEQPHI